jgi:hypothetical protein
MSTAREDFNDQLETWNSRSKYIGKRVLDARRVWPKRTRALADFGRLQHRLASEHYNRRDLLLWSEFAERTRLPEGKVEVAKRSIAKPYFRPSTILSGAPPAQIGV